MFSDLVKEIHVPCQNWKDVCPYSLCHSLSIATPCPCGAWIFHAEKNPAWSMGSEMTQDVGLVMALTENGDRRINSQVRCLAVNLEVVYWQKVLVWYRHGCKILKCSTWTCKIQKSMLDILWGLLAFLSTMVSYMFLDFSYCLKLAICGEVNCLLEGWRR